MTRRPRPFPALAGVVALAAAWTPGTARAQCAMCAAVAEASGGGSGLGPLLVAALVLLVPTLLLCGGAGYLLWRFRDADGEFATPRR